MPARAGKRSGVVSGEALWTRDGVCTVTRLESYCVDCVCCNSEEQRRGELHAGWLFWSGIIEEEGGTP